MGEPLAIRGGRARRYYTVTRPGAAALRAFTLGMTDQGTPEILEMVQAGALFVLLIGSANIANLLLARECLVLAALHAVDPDQPPTPVITLAQAIHERTMGLQVIGFMMAGLGGLALVLAAIGIYSLMSYYVSQRRHEIGVRMALGATRRDVARLTIRQAGGLSAIGLGLGTVLALAANRAVEGVLFGTVSLSPVVFVGIVLTLAATAAIATLAPTRQATPIDPATALRSD